MIKNNFLSGKFSIHGRFFWLLVALVLSLVISVFLYHHVIFRWASVGLLFFVLIAAILAVRESRRFITFLIIIAALSFLFAVLDLIFTNTFSQFCSKLGTREQILINLHASSCN